MSCVIQLKGKLSFPKRSMNVAFLKSVELFLKKCRPVLKEAIYRDQFLLFLSLSLKFREN